MKKKTIAISAGLIAVVALAITGGALAFSAANPAADGITEKLKATAANTVIESGNIKDKVTTVLNENRSTIAATTGLSEAQVDTAVANLALDEWEATPLPHDAVVVATQSTDFLGTSSTITTYEDPSYVTVDAFGQSITLHVPESAREYLGYMTLVP
ncbi:MAG: hypothetical protein RR362_01525 [Raoultibacter sp.]